ncbi:MAG: hypothetical protein R3208_05850 [Ketobacteraceae bacterium]|nr:hypothetical protein [Ketobacteraceae bacterium]
MSTIKKTLLPASFVFCLSLAGQGYATNTEQVLTYPDGSRYTGQLTNGKPGGEGKIQWSNGDSYQGEWRDAQPHGQGIKTFLDGSVYEGEFVRGQQQGQGQLTYPDGTTYNGEWQGGAPNGQGSFSFRDAGTYIGAVYMGLPHGRGSFTYANGDVYTGQWEHGKRSGMGKLRYRNGDIYVGRFEKGQPEGTGAITYASGFRFKGNFSGGKPHGDGTCYKQNEQALCSYINGEQIAYAVIPDYGKKALPAVDGPVRDAATTTAAAISAKAVLATPVPATTDNRQPGAKKAFVAALTEEKRKLKPSYQREDLNPERSDILFHHNFETLELGKALRTGWWETQSSLFSKHLLLHARSGDLELELTIKRFAGPGTYRIKPEQIEARFKGRPLKGLKNFANTITIRKLEDQWLEGNINLSFQEKDTYGDHYKVEHGVFRLANERPYSPF